MSVSASLKADEVARFDALARDWWDPDGPMAPLHRINPLRIGWLIETIARRFKRQGNVPLEGLSILDVGCGIGQYAEITKGDYLGVDLMPKYIDYATRRARGAPNRSFRCADVGTLVDEHREFDIVLMVENEHECNVGTGKELGRLLRDVNSPALRGVWDPGNAIMLGETPFPDGYRRLSTERIAHVHAKDCRMEDRQPAWCTFGEGGIDWKGQIRALAEDGYKGWISLETHWTGPRGDKREASVICGRRLKTMSGPSKAGNASTHWLAAWKASKSRAIAGCLAISTWAACKR